VKEKKEGPHSFVRHACHVISHVIRDEEEEEEEEEDQDQDQDEEIIYSLL